MKKILFFITALPTFLLVPNVAFAQKKNQLEGVWQIVEAIVPHANPAGKDSMTTDTNPQPSLIIFTKGYYSIMAIEGGQIRVAVEPAKDPQNLTDAEKITRFTHWSPFHANSGTYEIKGSMLIRHPIVAKNVNTMNREIINELKLEGTNMLWLIPSSDRATMDPRLKLKKLE